MEICVKMFAQTALISVFAATGAMAETNVRNVEVKEVSEDTFIRAEVDARLLAFQQAGGMNRVVFYAAPTPTVRQVVQRITKILSIPVTEVVSKETVTN